MPPVLPAALKAALLSLSPVEAQIGRMERIASILARMSIALMEQEILMM